MKLGTQRHIEGIAVDSANSTLTDTAPGGNKTLRKLTQPFFPDPSFRRLVFDSRVPDLFAPVPSKGRVRPIVRVECLRRESSAC